MARPLLVFRSTFSQLLGTSAMAQQRPADRNVAHRPLKKDSRLASRYLDRNRSDRLARRVQNALGFRFFLGLFGMLVAIFSGALLVEAASVFTAYTTDLPPVNALANEMTFKSTQILDRNGKILYRVNDENGGKRIPVHLGDVSQPLIDATIATEDKDFYSNAGIDPMGIARALWQNLVAGEIAQGASTITQQLAKNVLIDREARTDKTYVRKIQEAALAFRISELYSKSEILEMYLNQVYYGHLSYGIEAAAETYFGKHAGELNLAEAALLAGLPQAPSDYDPYINPEKAKDRRGHVLDRMVEQGYVTSQEAERTKTADLGILPQRPEPFEAPHFVLYIRQLLEDKYGPNVVYHQGLKVTTTLDLDMNKMAEDAIKAHMQALETQDANNAAVVSIDPKTGEILAMVGSRDYFEDSIAGEVNMAVAPRQPGSTIKPIEYSLAFMKGWGPETLIADERASFPNTAPYLPDYRPYNFDGKFDGPMTIRYALANSKNIPAVKTLMFDTVPDFVDYAAQLGIHFEKPEVYGLSLALGAGSVSPLRMASAYAALDNNGVYHQPVAILKVEDWKGNVLEEWHQGDGRQVIGPVQAYMITSILSDNWTRTPLQGPNSVLRLSDRPAAAKTGSTDDYKDSWTIGYTPDLSTAVWVGNTDNRAMREVLGSMGAGKIWHTFMENVHKGKPVQEFTVPPGAREYKLCLDTGQPAYEGCRRVLSEVYPETYTPAEYAIVPGLTESPTAFQPRPGNQGRPLGLTVSDSGFALVPVPTPGQAWELAPPEPGLPPVPVGVAPVRYPSIDGEQPSPTPSAPAPASSPPQPAPASSPAPAGPAAASQQTTQPTPAPPTATPNPAEPSTPVPAATPAPTPGP